MQDDKPHGESIPDPVPGLQVQRRRRRRTRKTRLRRATNAVKTWTPLMILLGLTVLTGGVVRVVEGGSGSGGAAEEKGTINASSVIEELDEKSKTTIVGDVQEVLAEAVRDDALEILNPEITSAGAALGFNSDEDPLDQILDWQLIEEVRGSELEDSKFSVRDTKEMMVN